LVNGGLEKTYQMGSCLEGRGHGDDSGTLVFAEKFCSGFPLLWDQPPQTQWNGHDNHILLSLL
jgi:hypothetical protein